MPPFVEPNLYFGRAPDGASKVMTYEWPSWKDDKIEWENLTNEEIIVLLTSKTIHCVVLQDKEDGDKKGGASEAEFEIIRELFKEFDDFYEEHHKRFKVYYCYNKNLDPATGKYSSGERAGTITKWLKMRMDDRIKGYERDQGYSFTEVGAEVPAGCSRFVEANYWGGTGLPPAIDGAYAMPSMDGSNVDTGDSHE